MHCEYVKETQKYKHPWVIRSIIKISESEYTKYETFRPIESTKGARVEWEYTWHMYGDD